VVANRLRSAALIVILIGTGFPRPNPNHAGPCTVVDAGGEWFAVDAGRGATMRIAATKLDYAKLRAVFVTHFHSDHTAGLPDLFDTSWQFGRKTRPFALYGPPGTKRLAGAMLAFFADDIHYRRDLLEKHPAIGATIDTHEVQPGVAFDDGRVKVTAFVEDHGAVKPAYGYRFESGGKVVVVSGDTRPNDTLVRNARGADVLVMEAYLPEWFDKVDTPEVAARLKSYHTSAEEAGTLATRAGVKTLVLTHLIPPDAESEFAKRAAKTFRGRIVVGRDLMRIE
jgi:ribonuclease Z